MHATTNSNVVIFQGGDLLGKPQKFGFSCAKNQNFS